MNEGQERQEGGERFFSVKRDEGKKDSIQSSLNQSTESEDTQKSCLASVTFRVLQFFLPCLRRKGVWEPSQGDVFKSHDAEEANYPRTLKILESKVVDVIFVSSCLLSIYLFLFSEGFLIESRMLWGVIHLVNSVYAAGLFSQWLQILIKSKYAKTNHGYTTKDIVYTLVSVFPTDIIILAIHNLNDTDDNNDNSDNPIKDWMITVSRLNYLLRIRSVLQYFNKWEDHLVVGDFTMLILRTVLSCAFLLHMFACIWHRLACDSFQLKHFKLTPDEATVEVCRSESWLGLLKTNKEAPLLNHPNWHVLATHYFVSVYWTIIATFRLGASDIKTSLSEEWEIAFVAVAQIIAWIYVLTNVHGPLISLLVEKDTERENFLTRCFAIRRYLNFGGVSRSLQDDVTKYYHYLWDKSRGIRNLDLVDAIPQAMKAEVFYDVNQFALEQLPMLKGLETPLLMSLCVHTTHKFCLGGEVLFRKQDTAQGLYYIVKGHLEILSDDEHTPIATIRCGSAIGEVNLLQPYPHVATVRCGSDCDILVLRRKYFKRVLSVYHQYKETLEQRLEARLEQSGLLLGLCEKHNTYHKAFKALHEFNHTHDNELFAEGSSPSVSVETVKVLDATADYDALESGVARGSDDLDGLHISSIMESRLAYNATHSPTSDRKDHKGYDELLAAAYQALQSDVARASSLASDLNIPRPPLIVTAPDLNNQAKPGFGSGNFVSHLLKLLKESNKGRVVLFWKFLVSVCALLALWYYPYQFAFRNLSHIKWDYIAHALDVVFLLDTMYDMVQVVVTPQITIENTKEILGYRLKSWYFYLRVLSFVPFEYMFAPVVGSGEQLSPYFYLFKFNRLLEIHLVFRFMSFYETRSRFSLITLFLGKFALGLFFVTHIFAVAYVFAMRDIHEDPKTYEHAFYWALVVVTSCGYGDLPAEFDDLVTVETIGLVVGLSTLIYMGAKLSSILVNTERRRVLFKQSYFGLQEYMSQRKFPKRLQERDTPTDLQNEFCIALSPYIIPPDEVLLYANELARDLYIIHKGSCEVIHQGKRLGVFSEGRYFGMNGLLYGINTAYQFKTITHCHVFVLTFESFMKVASANQNFLHEYKLLTGEEKLSRFRHEEIQTRDNDSLYPSEEFIAQLVESSPKERVSPLETNTNPVSTFLKNTYDCLKSGFCDFYLLPNGQALRWWLTFRVGVIIYNIIFLMAHLTFHFPPEETFWKVFVTDVMAWIDIVISFRIAYFGPDKQLVTKTGRMALHYLSGPFIIDVLACFPADYIMFFYLRTKPEYNNQYYVITFLRLNRILQVYKLMLARKVLKKNVFKSLSFVMLLELVPLMFLFINVTTCLSVLAVCGVSKEGKVIECDEDAWIIRGLRHLNYGGTVPSNLLIETFRSYVIGVYWVTQSVMCVGFGDIDIGTDPTNQKVAIIVIFVGLIVASFTGGKLTSCIVGDDPVRMELQEKMKSMNTHLEQHRVSTNSRRRVRETYFNAWDKTKGVVPKTLFLALPPGLKTDVMKQLYEPMLRSSPLFQNLDTPAVRLLANSLTEIFYPEGEFLMKFGDLSNDVFFIAQGAVVCYNVRGDIMCQMGSGSIIGETAAFFHTHRLYSAIAVKDVNAYIFKKDGFMYFLKQYPQIKKLVETCSVKHYKEAMANSKVLGNLGFELSFAFQNEVGIPDADEGGASGEQTLKVPVLQMGSVPSAQDPKARKSYSESSHFEDVTRTAFKDEMLQVNEDLAKVAKDKWWLSTFITFGRRARDEMGLLHICQEWAQCNPVTFTIHPSSAVCNWVSFYLFVTALSCSITASEIAFSTANSTESTSLIVVRYILEIFFIMRIVGNFHLGFYDSTANLITNSFTISRRYMYKVDGLWLDLLTTLPFYILSDAFGVKPEYARSVQLLRVYLFVRYLNESDADLKMKAPRSKIYKITILLCFIFHFWACAWYLVACYDGICTRGSWMDKTLDHLQIVTGGDHDSVPSATRYLLSLYYVTNAITFTGFQEITARTNGELLITIAMIFATVFVIGYLVGEMTQCLASQVATKIHYQHKLSVLESHFWTLGLSKEKVGQVRHYFKLLWCRCKGVTLFNLMEELPYPLRADVAMEIYGQNLKSSRILGKLDDNLIRQISARIRHEIYFPGSHIVRAGDVCTSMYFIKQGEVVILDGNSNLQLCVEVLYEMECFGEVKILLPREQYRFSYIARLESEVGVLHKEDLEAVLKNHPKIFDELRDKANRVKSRRQSIKEEEDRGAIHGVTSSSTMSIKPEEGASPSLSIAK